MPAPATGSRHLYTGHHQDSMQSASWLRARPQGAPLSRDFRPAPVLMSAFYGFDASAVVHTCSSSRRTPRPAPGGTFPHRSRPRLLTDAACGGLGPPTARRSRRTYLHHWHSTVHDGDHLPHVTPLSGHTPVPVGIRVKYRLCCRFQHHADHCLCYPIGHRRNRQRPPLPRTARLGNINPPGREGTVTAISQRGSQLTQEQADAVLLHIGDADPVDARRAVVPAHLNPRALQHVCAADLVEQRMEPPPGISLGRPVKHVLQSADPVTINSTQGVDLTVLPVLTGRILPDRA